MKRITLLVVLVVLFVAGIPILAAAQAGGTLTVEAYWSRLASIQEQLQALVALPAAQAEQPLAVIAAELDAIRTVRLPDGREVGVSHGHLTILLLAESPEISKAVGLLETILAEKDSWPASAFGAGELETLERVLSRPAYNWPEESRNPIQEFIRQVYSWVIDAIINIFSVQWVRQLSSALAIVGLAAVILYFLRSTLGSVVAESALEETGADGERHTASSAYEKAGELSQAGDYRTAVRYLYLSALLSLEEEGLIRYNRSLTNREYIRSVADRPALRSRLAAIVEVFDRVWYGYQPLDEAGFQAYAGQVRRLREERP